MLPIPLPPEWQLRESKDCPGRVYYYNTSTQESTWVRPVPYPDSEIQWPPLVYASHILVKHRESEDATTWRAPSVTRSHEEARVKITNIRRDIEKGVRTFEEIAKEESDCNDTHESGGNLGWIKRGATPARFESAAFALRIGEVSHPVETRRGWHLIVRRG
jgi:NIMA-interacting peptidyl-prolyl cis-trans isomerase 1